MGRAMLIIAAGAIIAVGILQVGVQGKRSSIAKNAAVDAYEVEIRNKAFTAAQITMERINKEGNSAENPWTREIDGIPVTVSYNIIPSTGTGAFAQLEEETVEINASAEYYDPVTNQERDINIFTTYLKTAMHFVPEFKGALQFATDASDFNFDLNGSGSIVGNDASGTGCPSKPAVVVKDQDSADKIEDGNNTSGGGKKGGKNSKGLVSDTDLISIDDELSYQPVDELVARLADMEGTVKINSTHPNMSGGNWNGDLGSPDKPGVFFVEDYAKFKGNSEGWGILVVRNNAEIEGEELVDIDLDGELDLVGGFEFNGLVIFENAYKMKGRGNVNVNGSILVGQTEGATQPLDFTLDASGNFTASYDCVGEKYAQLASALSLGQNRYKRVSTYE